LPGSRASPVMNPKFSVVLVTFRRPTESQQVLEALEKLQGPPPFEVLVMDNDQQSSARSVVSPFLVRHPNWRYEVTSRNNVSLARNVGAGLANGEWLAFLDDDCVPYADWLAKAETTAASCPERGVVFGGGYEDKTTNISTRETWPKDRYLVEGNLFFRRTDYLALGGMRTELGPDKTRFGYHEGSDLQRRYLARFGNKHQRIFEPRLAVRHLEANKLPKGLLVFYSGVDSVRAFPSSQRTPAQVMYQYLKIPGPIFRLAAGCFSPNSTQRKKRWQKELYRIGEIAGELDLLIGDLGRFGTQFLRRLNNRKTSMTKGLTYHAENARATAYPKIPPPSPEGWMAGKVGTTELLALEYCDRRFRPPLPAKASWRRPMSRLFVDSGVFPNSKRQFDRFIETYKKALESLDVVCLWQDDPFLRIYEEAVIQAHCPRAVRVGLDYLSTEILAGIASRPWLVISPFVETMRQQVDRLPLVHASKSWAGSLRDVRTRCEFMACPTFSYLAPSPFPSWSEGLEKLAEEALRKKFEVALIGAGAWSLPLAARLKKAGKIAIHLGGETQLAFGIKGQRWEAYGIYNEHWVRPSAAETPNHFLKKENGCYW